eukprot:scaffold36956_cov62-Phaeocystis_antarctica.AAC.5
MYYMFGVCSARALPAAPTVGPSLHAACAAAVTPRPPIFPPPWRRSSDASLSTRQYASSFNQPLSLDTSSVTTMQYMFQVRSARALPATSIIGSAPPSTLLAPPLLLHALPSRRPPVAPLLMLPFRLGRGRWASTSR